METINFLKKQNGLTVAGVAVDGREAMTMANNFRPDVVLMNIDMPINDSIQAGLKIKGSFPKTRLVFVTVHEDMICEVLAEVIHDAGLVRKSPLSDDLKKALQQIVKT